MRNRIKSILAGVLLATAVWTSAPAAEPVTITVTDKVLVQDTTRIGINLCSDNYWDSAILKMRAVENFEGLRFRMITWGPQIDEHGIYVWFRPTWEIAQSKSMAGKVRYTFLGGPDKGKSGMVKDVREQVCPADNDKRKLCYIEFDRAVTPAQANQLGVLLEYDKPDHGSMGHGSEHNWNSEENSVHIGDVPPGSFGQASLWLRGSEKEVYYNYAGVYRPMDEQNGTWRVRLWAKAKAGTPSFRVRMGGISGAGNQAIDVPVTETWKQHDLTIEVNEVRDNQNVGFELRCSGGEVLVDDVEIWKDEQNSNPTVFRDIVVDPLKKLNPGIVRFLQMGGSDFETNLRQPLKQMPWTRDWNELNNQGRNGSSIYRFNFHDFYVLCEHIGADPWYCLPGTLHPEEINILMEYLGAPAKVGYGKVRAKLGHPKPWTAVFQNIYVEYGNEAWNSAGYATGSFNGPDHWKDMTAVGKSSPHYRRNVVFVGGAQAGWPEIAQSVIRNFPNLDRVAVAPYMLHSLKTADVAPLDTDNKLFKWVFGFTDRRVDNEKGETTHAKNEPTFTAHGIMAWEWQKKPEFVDYGPLPTIRSYAFKDGKTRGMILVNFDTTDAHTVKLALPTAVKNKTAKAWRLAAGSIAVNNEYETGEPQVKIAEETINNFSSGSESKLPPHSMLVLKWEDSK